MSHFKQLKREKTSFRTMKQAKAEHNILKKYPEQYNAGLNGILKAFSEAKIPNWGGLTFNGQRV